MKTKKIILTKGLPASGKSTWAKELLAKESNWKRINKDDLRAMLDNGTWSRSKEEFILKVRNAIIRTAMIDGYNVIVDDTNFGTKHEDKIKQIVAESNKFGHDDQYEVEIKDFTDVPLEECIKRDSKRANYVGEKVIKGMYKQFLKPEPKVVVRKVELPEAILCDIDGTLALFGKENPYQRDFSKDILNEKVARLVNFQKHAGFKVILVSGRDGTYRKETQDWLASHGLFYDKLFMRVAGDNRKDSIIKEEIYHKEIEGQYNVEFVLDDRNQVVELWRNLGLTCLQVAEGDF
jgi:predicted kinase